MNDISHIITQDIGVSATGDMLAVSGSEMGKQRVLRRLLTNPGEYIAHPDYGAGMGLLIGRALDAGKVKALIRGQMLLESAVARTPEPQVSVSPIDGGLQCDISYTDAATGGAVALSFNVTK